MPHRLFATLALALAAPVAAQAPEAAKAPKWDVNAPPGAKLKTVAIDVTEGSWMDVDVSPDGRTLAFALLGDIYTLPIGGGTATRIAEGLAWEVQPRFSPDGRRIAFTSDRGGGDNIWIMNADGSDKRQLTKESFRLVYQPSWSPDGRFIAGKKHFTTQRSLGTGEIWLWHVSGGAGQLLVKRPSEQHQKELGEPGFAPDGRRIFFSRNVSPGPIFEYAQDSNSALFAAEVFDLVSGETTTAVSAPGGAVRPTPSPDGQSLAFIRRERDADGRFASSLFVRELGSGRERRLLAGLDRDMQETWAVTGVYPNIAWTPDSRSLVLWANGRLVRVEASTGAAQAIPFRVADSRQVVESLHPKVEVAPDRFTTRMARFASLSPDGRTLLFESLGKLWLKPAAGGPARRLTAGEDGSRELFPAWSRDGRRIAYVRWTDSGLGEIRLTSPGGGAGRVLVAGPGHYGRLAFAPDGALLAFEKRRGGGLVADFGAEEAGVHVVPVAGGPSRLVARDVGQPHFGAANDRLFVNASAAGKQSLVSMDLAGGARRTHASGEMATDFRVSPDGSRLAFRQNYEAHVMPLLPGPQEVSVDSKGGAFPVVRASSGGADWLGWGADGRTLHWSMGPTLFRADAGAMLAEGAPAFTPPATGLSMAMEAAADKPRGLLALVNARIVTMAAADGGVIDNGVLLIEGDRIRAVGRSAEVAVPPGTRTVDLGGRTVIPGLIDAHAHGPVGTGGELVPQQNWVQQQTLALGVTTVHDPSNRASEFFAGRELQQAGLLLAPRLFSTGEIVYGARSARVFADVNGPDDARAHVRRLKAQGAGSIKNYNQPRREQRQQVILAGQAEGMQVVAEGGSLFGLGITHLLDGNATHEHNLPVERMYEDVLQLWAGTRVAYTPTLVVAFGGVAGDPYWRAHTNVFDQPLLKAHTPPDVLAESLRRPIAPEDQYFDGIAAREAKRLADRGVLVSIGAHGQQPGIAAHWEMWSFVRGGMSPLEALKAATIVPARSLGMADDIGSLEPGKLADLVVLGADPLADIRNSEKVVQVMQGGRLYDAATLDQVAPVAAKRPPHWWTAGGAPGGGGGGWRTEASGHGH